MSYRAVAAERSSSTWIIDGDLDLVVVTGFDAPILAITGPSDPLYKAPSVLFINDGTGNFTRLSGAGLDDAYDSRALIAFDHDRDGDVVASRSCLGGVPAEVRGLRRRKPKKEPYPQDG